MIAPVSTVERQPLNSGGDRTIAERVPRGPGDRQREFAPGHLRIEGWLRGAIGPAIREAPARGGGLVIYPARGARVTGHRSDPDLRRGPLDAGIHKAAERFRRNRGRAGASRRSGTSTSRNLESGCGFATARRSGLCGWSPRHAGRQAAVSSRLMPPTDLKRRADHGQIRGRA